MKKLTAFIICLVLCLSFVACGESKTENPGGDGQQPEQTDNTNKAVYKRQTVVIAIVILYFLFRDNNDCGCNSNNNSCGCGCN